MGDLTELAKRWSSVPRIYTVKASGDGKWVFWSWEARHETAEIHAVLADGSGVPERLTFGTDHHYLCDVNFDGSKLIVGQSKHGSEHDQLLLLDRGNGNAVTALTPVQANHYVYGGRFGLDADWIIFIADFDYETGRVTEGGWIYRQDLATGERRVLLKTISTFTEGPELSPDRSMMLWSRHELHPGGDQIWVMGTDGDNPRELLNLGAKARISAEWLDDRRIVFVASGPTRDRVGVVAVATGAVTWLKDAEGFNPQLVVAGKNGAFVCLAFEDSNLKPVLFDTVAGKESTFPKATDRRFAMPLAAFPGGSWLVEAYDADAPHTLFRVDADGASMLLAEAPKVTRVFIRPISYHWSSTDGTPVQGWLYEPEGPSKGLVVWVHGGPTWHSEDWVNPKVQFYVNAGFTVLDPNYRGSTGFGMAFREAVKDDGWGGREQDDIRSGIEALVRDGRAERGKIAVIGLSYGGYSSWVAITRFADLVNAAVPICGMYRLDIDYHATEMPHGRAYSEEMMGGTPEQLGEKYRLASPGNFIDAIKGSLLIVHGRADSNVGPENTHAAVRELTAKGIAHEVLWFEDEGHGVTRQSNLLTFMVRTAAFLEKAFGR